MSHPIAVFDIDGTLFRSALEAELNLAMIDYGLFPKIVKHEIEESYMAWINRQGSYDDYLNKLIEVFDKRLRGVSEEDLQLVSRLVMQTQHDRVYVFTRDLIKKLRTTHKLIAISGAPKAIIDEFNTYWKFDYVYGTEFVTRKGVYTGKKGFAPFVDKKKTLLTCIEEHRLTLKNSTGIGDTENDIPFLETVEHPIAFNPNSELYHTARKRDWRIVVERKNVVYELSYGGLRAKASNLHHSSNASSV